MILDVFAVVRWWLALMLIGAVATPLTWYLFGGSQRFGRLPSLGYAFTKPLGLLLVSYLFWLLGSLGFLANDLGAVVLSLALVLAASLWLQRKRTESIRDTLRVQRNIIIVTELVFLLAFIFWAWVRAQNPAILNTEKPMEFAFLNAILRSPSFPPIDPWLSGFAISYYYFGYVMTSLLARLSAVAPASAFNLGLAWLFAATITGAFGLIRDLIVLSGPRTQATRRIAVTLGIIGALAIGMAGNLQIILEVAHANGYGSADFWATLDIRDINEPTPAEGSTPRYESGGWWWWRSSRVINEYHLSGRNETGLNPIAEFPGFSFTLGDMHPHVLALPYAFLSIAIALVWYLRTDPLPQLVKRKNGRVQFDPTVTIFGLTALVIGGLSFLNTWDVLIHLFVLVASIVLAQWRHFGRWHSDLFLSGIGWFFGFGIAGYVLYLPFYVGFSSQAGAPFILPMLMQPTRLAHFATIFGMPLLVITLLLLTLLIQNRFARLRTGIVAMLGIIVGLFVLLLFMSTLIAASPAAAGAVTAVASELGITLADPPDSSIRLGYAFGVVRQLLGPLLAARLSAPLVTLLLAFFIGSSFALTSAQFAGESAESTPTDDPKRTWPLPFVLLLIVTASLLTLGPEFVYLKDQFGQRLNTIFKFYYQAWVMFGVASVVGLYILNQRTRIVGLLTSGVWVALFAGAMLFPYYMIQWSSGNNSGEATLNGLAFVRDGNNNEYMALRWLQTQVDGTPVVLEATGGAYTEYARVSARTGLPTVLGWANHERQWRGNTPEPGERDPVIQQIYAQRDWDGIPALLDRYDVSYIYVGHLERQQYGEVGLDKFKQHLEVAYQNASVTIYAWKPNG